MIEEIWKPIKGYEDKYEISNLGNVKSLYLINGQTKIKRERMLKKYKRSGYWCVALFKENQLKNKFIHRLIAEVFIPNLDNKPCVNHKDGNKLNNSIENLEWCTHKENIIHAWDKGLCENARYTLKKHNKETIEKIKRKIKQYDLDGNFIQEYNSITEASKKYNIHPTNIKNACKGRYKTSCGFVWKYSKERLDKNEKNINE